MRRTAISLLLDLAQQSDQFPPSVLISTKNRLEIEEQPWRGGGCADVYRGLYDGQAVAIKTIKATASQTSKKEWRDVSTSNSHICYVT
jgi:hypothetical protein